MPVTKPFQTMDRLEEFNEKRNPLFFFFFLQIRVSADLIWGEI